MPGTPGGGGAGAGGLSLFIAADDVGVVVPEFVGVPLLTGVADLS